MVGGRLKGIPYGSFDYKHLRAEEKEEGRKTLFDVEVGLLLKVLGGQSLLLTPWGSTKV